MSNDTERNTDEQISFGKERAASQGDGSTSNPERKEPPSRTEWEELEPNPDPATDLGYRTDDWERFETSDSTDQIIYLPSDDCLIKEDAFIVAEQTVLCDLGEHY